MPLEWWISLIIAISAVAISPGNGAVLSIRYGLKGGVSYTTPVILGLQLGLLGIYGIMLICLMLTTKISPRAIDVIALLGGAYLLYLGGKDIWDAWEHPAEHSKFAARLHKQQSNKESIKKRVTIGLFTNLTNPKGILFMAAFFPQWLRPHAEWTLARQAIAMGVIVFIIDFTVMHSYAYLASKISHLLDNPKAFKAIQTALGVLLCLIGIGMVMSRFLVQ
jgi:homoserine/homoserine lactone efflux protein